MITIEGRSMTHEQFRHRLLKLLREARHAGCCPACITLELATAAAAIVELAHVTPDQLGGTWTAMIPPPFHQHTFTEVPMLKSTLDLKASVTRRTPATPLPSDMAERLAQLQHHQTAEALATVDSVAAAISDPATLELEPAPARDPETEKSGKQLKREAHALQFGFLSACLGKPVTVFLINGIRLTGKLRQYDQYCILLEGPDALNSMIFKHACASIVPAIGR